MVSEFVEMPGKCGLNMYISGRTKLSVLKLEHAEDTSLPKNPLLIYNSVKQIAGKIEGGFPHNGGVRYTLKVSNPDQVKALLQMDKLIDGTPVVVTEHVDNNVTHCVVKCREVMDLTEEELLEELVGQGVIGVRKITRKSYIGLLEETPSIVLSFSGSDVPEYVSFAFFRVKTYPYYPQLVQCFKCWQFWHIKPNCSCDAICGTCSGPHDTVDVELCTKKPYCLKCKTDQHSISSRKCMKYVEETIIARIKIDRNISYEAAKKAYERENVISVRVLLEQVAELEQVIKNKDHEIQVLRGIFNTMQQARKLQSENQPVMPQKTQSNEKVPQTAVVNKMKQERTQLIKRVPQPVVQKTKQEETQSIKKVPQTVGVNKSKSETKHEHSQKLGEDEKCCSIVEDSKTIGKSAGRTGKKKRGKAKK